MLENNPSLPVLYEMVTEMPQDLRAMTSLAENPGLIPAPT